MQKIDCQTMNLWGARIAVGLAAIGVMVGYRTFVLMKIGPVYALEVLFLIWLACASYTLSRQSLRTFGQLSYPTLLFTGWAILRLGYDLITVHFAADLVPYSRIAQHTITVVYPMMWTLVGYWCYTTGPSFARHLGLVLVVFNVLPHLVGRNVTNIAAGPLIALPFLLGLHRWRWDPHHQGTSLKNLALVLGLACLTFLPFWRLWGVDIQRTTFLILIISMLLVPWVLKSKGESYWRCLQTNLIAFGIFVSGLAIQTVSLHHSEPVLTAAVTLDAPVLPESTQKQDLVVPPVDPHPAMEARDAAKNKGSIRLARVFDSFYHGEDRVDSHRFRFPVMRTRRQMWKSALDSWRSHPFEGVGFVPEVPVEFAPGVKNDWGIEWAYAPPISGPHNSYLTILARTGIMGSLLFLWMTIQFMRQAGTVSRRAQPLDVFDLLLFIIPLNGAIHAILNVGFESPARAMLMWLFLGMLTARYAPYRTEQCVS